MDPISAKDFNEYLRKRKLTVVCAESITAGLLASTIASVSGASDVLIGSIVTYSRNLKTAVLGVDPRIIDKNTAESQQTTTEMAYGLTRVYPAADIFIAVTGVASEPSNGYKVNKKVGQIYVAVYYRNKMYEKRHLIKVKGLNPRNPIREKAVEFIFSTVVKIVK
jgi:nicotinamide-nucleotide amidase